MSTTTNEVGAMRAQQGFDLLVPAAMGDDRLQNLILSMGLHRTDDDETPPNSTRRAVNAAAVANPEGFLAHAASTSPQGGFGSQPPSQGLIAIDHGADDDDDLPPPPDMQEGEDPLTELERSNLYVSNISTDVDDDGLRDMFAPFGCILNSRIMVDIHTCKSRGFGFVQFSKPGEAAKAVRTMDGSVHHSQTLMVRLASRKTRQPGSLTSKMFLRNVPAGVSEDELRRICQRFGAVTTCAVRPDVQHGVITDDLTGGMSQVAYITFADVDTTKRAAASLNNSKPWLASVHPLLAKVLDSNQKRRKEDEGGSLTSLGRNSSPPGLGDSRNRASGVRTGGTPNTSATSQPSHSLTNGAGSASYVMPHAGASAPSLLYPTMMYPTPGFAPPPVSFPVAPLPQPYVPQPMGFHPAQYAAQPAVYPGGAVPSGYQVVMQPTLQPVYMPTANGTAPGFYAPQYAPMPAPPMASVSSSNSLTAANTSGSRSGTAQDAHAQRKNRNPFAR